MHAPDRPTETLGAAITKPTANQSADMAGQLLHQKSANQLNDQLNEEFQQHRVTMALIGKSEKAGNASLRPTSMPDQRSAFPALAEAH